MDGGSSAKRGASFTPTSVSRPSSLPSSTAQLPSPPDPLPSLVFVVDFFSPSSPSTFPTALAPSPLHSPSSLDVGTIALSRVVGQRRRATTCPALQSPSRRTSSFFPLSFPRSCSLPSFLPHLPRLSLSSPPQILGTLFSFIYLGLILLLVSRYFTLYKLKDRLWARALVLSCLLFSVLDSVTSGVWMVQWCMGYGEDVQILVYVLAFSPSRNEATEVAVLLPSAKRCTKVRSTLSSSFTELCPTLPPSGLGFYTIIVGFSVWTTDCFFVGRLYLIGQRRALPLIAVIAGLSSAAAGCVLSFSPSSVQPKTDCP